MSIGDPVIFVVDSEAAARQAMRTLIESAGWRAQTFASGAEFLAQPRASAPNCLLLDVELPDISGLELQARLAHRRETPIIFMAGDCDVSTSVLAMKAGAVEFLTKPLREDMALNAMASAVTLSARTLRREAEANLLRSRYEALSRRERQVLALVTRGYLNKQVGQELGISEITVKVHRGRVMRKMAAASLAQLVCMASNLSKAGMPPSTRL